MNNRVGCILDDEYADDFEDKVGKYYGSKETLWGSYLRKENGCNFAFSAFGSLLYLIGSIMFIPATNLLTLGTIIFIVGSSVIFLSQSWKVYRQGLDIETREFMFSNYEADLPALGTCLRADCELYFLLIVLTICFWCVRIFTCFCQELIHLLDWEVWHI